MIPGFGGDHFMAPRFAEGRRMAMGSELIRVLLDPDCGTGHHVFADSATNGPRGAALVEEFIPYIEKTFPVVADPRARLLTGHSSGGWSSLWLQVTYPDVFGGTWSTSPDPVDFRDFQRIDLYARGENMYRDRKGQRRPIARMGTIPMLWYDNFCRMDDVIGWGGQLGSFEAVFSPTRWERPSAQALGPVHRRHRPGGGQDLGSLRHPAGAGAELADARPEAQGQAARDHRRPRHVLPRRGRAVTEGVAGPPRQRRGRRDHPEPRPQHGPRSRAGRAPGSGDANEGRRMAAGASTRAGKKLRRSLDRRLRDAPAASPSSIPGRPPPDARARARGIHRTGLLLHTPSASACSTGSRRRTSWRGSAKSSSRRPACRWPCRSSAPTSRSWA